MQPGIMMSVGSSLRLEPGFQQVAAMVAAGGIGKPAHGRLIIQIPNRIPIKELVERHLSRALDWVLEALGEVENMDVSTFADGSGVLAVLKTKGGAVVHIECASGYQDLKRIDVSGSGGRLYYDSLESATVRDHISGHSFCPDAPAGIPPAPTERLNELLQEVLVAIG
ncbi:MAG: hypothetical protein JSS72_07020 [Armatimonadetes bacterium]|nr:hypothetical protein [Armatimonadota bacterium]